MQFIIFLIVLYCLFKSRKLFGTMWNSVDSNTKITIVDKPTKYRTYNKYVHLIEIVHYDIVPAMGAASEIVEYEIDDIIGLLKNHKAKQVNMKQLRNIWNSVNHDFKNTAVIDIFFRLLGEKIPNQTYEYEDLLLSIKQGVVK